MLIHGDAAFAGQGVVAETLNLSELPGYDVGGTVHIVVNNQVGFTTTPGFARSTVYATDIAKAVQAPIFHVNGDDPEASMRVVQLAFAFRQAFKKDVVVDMVCYRRYGHNEGDEPAFTLPRMYEVIGQRRSVRKLYTELLVNRGDLTLEDAEKALEDFRARLDAAFEETRVSHTPQPSTSDLTESAPVDRDRAASRPASPRERLEQIADALVTVPPGFTVHPKLQRIIGNRRKELDDDRIDWSLAEALAFGSLLLEGTPGAPRRPGHAAGNVQPAPRGARRPRDRSGVHAARAPRRRRRAVHGLRLRALGVRRARLRVRLLGRRPRRARVLGSAVRRLRQRRADDHRPVHRRRRRQVGPAERPRAAAPPRLRGPGPRALVGPARALPRALRRRQHARRVPHHRGAVLPRAAPPGARHRAQADDRDDARSATCACPRPTPPASALESGAFQLVLPDPAAPDPASVTRLVFCTGKFGHELLARRDEVARAGRDRAPRAALPVARARDRRRARAATPTPRSCGRRKSPATWAPATSSAAASRRCAPAAPSAWSPAPRARAPRPAAPPCTTPSSSPSSKRPSPRPDPQPAREVVRGRAPASGGAGRVPFPPTAPIPLPFVAGPVARASIASGSISSGDVAAGMPSTSVPRAGRNRNTMNTPSSVAAAANSTPRCMPATNAPLICGHQLRLQRGGHVLVRSRSRARSTGPGGPGRAASRCTGRCAPVIAAATRDAVHRRHHAADDRDAERATDLAGRVVHRRADTGLRPRQRAHDRLGRRRHGEAHADREQDAAGAARRGRS